MRKSNGNILSLIISLLIIFVIIATVLLSLDLCGIIALPEKFSLKTYFPNTVMVFGSSDEEIYYPSYNATGTTAENVEKVTENLAQGQERVDLSEFNTTTTTNNYTYNVTDNSYFYNQLDDCGKTIYSKMFSSLDELKTGTATIDFGTTFNDLLQGSNGEKVLTDAFQLSINALLLDHPEIFYLDVTKIYLYTETTKKVTGSTYRISIGPETNGSYLADGFYSKSDVELAENQIKSELSDIIERLAGNTYDKIKQVHNYLIDNITYDSDNNYDMSHGIYGAMVNNLAVCDGYAKSFKYILDSIGISCVEVCGVGQNSSGENENHAWNDVYIDGKWYAVDVTWDDPIIIGGRNELTSDLRYANFLRGSNVFYSSHQEDGYIVSNGSFSYPTLSVSDYN